jgi:hypothetical protein
MTRVATAILSAACCLLIAPAVRADSLVTTVSNVAFYSDELINLHHVLYGAAWARRSAAAGPAARPLSGPLPAPLDAAMTADERAAWDEAVTFYDKHVASRDLLFGEGMERIMAALLAGTPDTADAVISGLSKTLTSSRPIYRKYFWPAHDRQNRDWIAAAVDRLTQVGPDCIARLERVYGTKWFTTTVRADVVWVGSIQGAYTTLDPTHATIASGEPSNSGWNAVEIVFHEMSHALVLPLQEALNAALRALDDHGGKHRQLWHVVQFYLTGTVVRQALAVKGIAYTPYLESTGLFDRAWPQYRTVIETVWASYAQGKTTRDEAIAATVKLLGGP